MEGVLGVGRLVHAALHRVLVTRINTTTARNLAPGRGFEELVVARVDGVTWTTFDGDAATAKLHPTQAIDRLAKGDGKGKVSSNSRFVAPNPRPKECQFAAGSNRRENR